MIDDIGRSGYKMPMDEALEAALRGNLFQLLFRVARRIDEQARARVNAEAGRVVARASTVALFPHLSTEGTSIGAIASALGITKQAVSKRVAELVEHGVVEVISDPDDARIRRVRLTPHGIAAFHHGLGVLAGLERDLTPRVGASRLDALREALVALDAALDDADLEVSASRPQ